jgi:hypothetical protein
VERSAGFQARDFRTLYLTAEVFDSPGVAKALEAHHVIAAEVLVKGVSDRLRVHKVGRRE